MKKRRTIKRLRARPKSLKDRPYRIDDGVTQSLLCNFVDCKQRCAYSLQGLRSTEPSEPLFFGNLWHSLTERLCQEIRKGAQPEDAERIFEKFMKGWLIKAAKLANFGALSTAHFLAAKAKAVFIPYCEHWAKDFKKDLWLELEGVFDVQWKGIRLRGRRDGLQQLTAAVLRLVERKTKGQIPTKLDDALLFDFQNLFYLLALNIELKQRDPKHKRVTKVLYDITRRPGQKLSKKGESLKHYYERIRELVEVEPDYYFKRMELIYSAKDQKAFEERLSGKLHAFEMWLDDCWPERNTLACMRGGYCDYMEACAYGNLAEFRDDGVLFEELRY